MSSDNSIVLRFESGFRDDTEPVIRKVPKKEVHEVRLSNEAWS